jgi:hypothetical protein
MAVGLRRNCVAAAAAPGVSRPSAAAARAPRQRPGMPWPALSSPPPRSRPGFIATQTKLQHPRHPHTHTHRAPQHGEVANRVLSVGSMDRALLIADLLEPPRPGATLFQHLSGRGFLTITGAPGAARGARRPGGCEPRPAGFRRALRADPPFRHARPARAPRRTPTPPTQPPTHAIPPRPLPGCPCFTGDDAHGHGQHGLCRARVPRGRGWPDGRGAARHVRRAAAAGGAGRHPHCSGRRGLRQVGHCAALGGSAGGRGPKRLWCAAPQGRESAEPRSCAPRGPG